MPHAEARRKKTTGERIHSMDINKMRHSDKSWYKNFFANSKLVQLKSEYVYPVEWRGKTSKNSFCFGNPTSQAGAFAILKNIFPFINEIKFHQATNGNGHEWKRITRLHSSSLLAFLMFSQISEKHRLVVKINGRDEEFTDVRFEVKNWIENNDTHPSNVDVVLANNTTVLFIESKFTEYLCRGRKSADISVERYGKRFWELFNEFQGIQCKTDREKSTLRLISSDEESHYIEGLKQVVAHYMGLEYASRNGWFGQDREARNGRCLCFAEVLFDFKDKKSLEALNDYDTLYQRFVEKLPVRNDIFVCPKIMTYHDLFKGFNVEESTRQFYGFDFN